MYPTQAKLIERLVIEYPPKQVKQMLLQMDKNQTVGLINVLKKLPSIAHRNGYSEQLYIEHEQLVWDKLTVGTLCVCCAR